MANTTRLKHSEAPTRAWLMKLLIGILSTSLALACFFGQTSAMASGTFDITETNDAAVFDSAIPSNIQWPSSLRAQATKIEGTLIK